MKILENSVAKEQAGGSGEEIIFDIESPNKARLEEELKKAQGECDAERAFIDMQFGISKDLVPLGFLVAADRALQERALKDAESGEPGHETRELDESLGKISENIYKQIALMRLLGTGKLDKEDLAEDLRTKGHEVDVKDFESAIEGIRSLVSALG